MKKIKKIKGCAGCCHFRQFFCNKVGQKKKIPSALLNGTKKCKARKKNKHVYF